MPPIPAPLPDNAVISEIETSDGPARAHLFTVAHGVPRASLVLGHGAGAGIDSPELASLAADLPQYGVEVVLIEQPWLVAGRKVADPAAKLDTNWVQAVTALRRSGVGLRHLVVGGRSTGARVACRTVTGTNPDAVIAFAYPLRPSRKETDSRAAELAEAAKTVPVTVI